MKKINNDELKKLAGDKGAKKAAMESHHSRLVELRCMKAMQDQGMIRRIQE